MTKQKKRSSNKDCYFRYSPKNLIIGAKEGKAIVMQSNESVLDEKEHLYEKAKGILESVRYEDKMDPDRLEEFIRKTTDYKHHCFQFVKRTENRLLEWKTLITQYKKKIGRVEELLNVDDLNPKLAKAYCQRIEMLNSLIKQSEEQKKIEIQKIDEMKMLETARDMVQEFLMHTRGSSS